MSAFVMSDRYLTEKPFCFAYVSAQLHLTQQIVKPGIF